MKKLFLWLFVLLSTSSVYVFAQSPAQCVYYGGYPWRVGGCLHAEDLNTIIAQALVWTTPGGISNDKLANNKITLEGQQMTLGSSYTLPNKANLVNPPLVSPSISGSISEIPGVITSTGSQSLASAVTIWRPTTPAATTFMLPSTSSILNGDRRTLDNSEIMGTFFPVIIPNSGQLIRSNGGLTTSFVVHNPGASVTMRFNATNSEWIPE